MVPRWSVPGSLLVLQCFPVAAPPLPVLPVVRPRWPVAPVRLVPLVQLAWQLLAVPRQRLAAQAQQAVELIPPVVVMAQAVPAAQVQALVADPVPRVVLPTQPPVLSAGILAPRTVLLVDLQEKPWEPKALAKALGRLLPRAPVQRPELVAGKPLADRLHPPGRRPVPQIVLLGLIPRPPEPANPQARRAELRGLLPGPAHPPGHRKRQHLVPGLRTLHPKPRRQKMLPPSQ